MAEPLSIFLSSTVGDLEAVRRALSDVLSARGHIVLTSESPSFPVAATATSHEACLKAIRTCHVFVAIVGERFGGEYRDQNKSVSWREWDEAMRMGLTPIVLVTNAANTLAQKCSRARQALLASNPALDLRQQDRLLMQQAEFADEKPRRDRFPGVQRFIDVLRKGHIDNWAHLDWDGTPEAAVKIIDTRIGALFVSYQMAHRQDQENLRRWSRSARATASLASSVAALTVRVTSGELSAEAALHGALDECARHRSELFGFSEADRYSFGVYFVDEAGLRPGPRAHDRRIQARNRRWRRDQSHVSLAVSRNAMLVSGDIRQTEAWVHDPSSAEQDRLNYVSVVSLPLYLASTDETPDAAFVVTSSRVDHFLDLDQPEVLTCEALARMFSVFYRTRGAS